MTNRKFSAIVFDLGQVLIPFDYKLFADKINQHKNGLGEQFLKKYKSNYDVHRQFEKGKIAEKDFIVQMLEYLEHKIDGETFCRYWSDIFWINKNVVALLPELKKNYNLYLLSNTNSIHKKYGYESYEFLKIFDKLFLSHEVGFIKPEEEIYRAVEKVSGIPSEEHIFIDDIKEYVDGAKKIGWDGIQYVGYDNLLMNLKERGIIFYSD
jgi:putative hydrolase of the HAD superfamily